MTAKRAMESAGQAAKGHSPRARRADLARWSRLVSAGRGLVSDEETPLDVAVDLAAVLVRDLTTDAVVNAVAEAKSMWSDATVARMLSTLRGFTRWLTRQQLLPSDPCDSELLRVSTQPQRRPRAVEDEDVEAMAAAALLEPTGRQQMFWPVRDVALVRFLAGTAPAAKRSAGRPSGKSTGAQNGRSGGSAGLRAASNATCPSPSSRSTRSTSGSLPAPSVSRVEPQAAHRVGRHRCSCAPTAAH